MSKPSVPPLRHAELLPGAIRGAEDRAALSAWWLSIPLFVLAMVGVRTLYGLRGGPFRWLHRIFREQQMLFLALFVIAPLALVVFNIVGMRRIYYLSGDPPFGSFLRMTWKNWVVILLCGGILFVYL